MLVKEGIVVASRSRLNRHLLECLTAVLMVVVTSLLPTCNGSWTTSFVQNNIPIPAGLREDLLTVSDPTSVINVFIVFRGNVSFAQAMQTDPAVLLGSCISSATDSKFGWNNWRSRFTYNVAVSDTVITLQLTPAAGYSPSKSDVISCGLGLPGTNGAIYALGTLDATDLYATFSVKPAEKVSSRLFLSCTSGNNNLYTTPQVTYTETAIRDNGLCIEVWMIGDNWDSTLVASMPQYLDCFSTDMSTCDTFRKLVRDSQYFFYDGVNSPQRFVISINRSVTRTFNPSQNIFVGFVPPTSRGQMYGQKNVAFTLLTIDNNFTVSGYSNALVLPMFRQLDVNSSTRVGAGFPPGIAGADSLNMDLSENCIRGKNSSTKSCPMVLLVYMASWNFQITTLGTSDLQAIGFYSNNTGAYLAPTFVASVPSLVLDSSGKTPALYMSLSGDANYDIAVKDVIQVYLPYSLFADNQGAREPPAYNLTITVWPSPGNISSDLFTPSMLLPQSTFWTGGAQYRITLGGESFLSEFAADFLNLTYIQGTADAAGWSKWKSCALPERSIYFDTIHGKLDKRVLVLNFQECPQYAQAVTMETIALTFGTQYLASGIALATPPTLPLVFTVIKSTPVYAVTGTVVYTIDDVLNGAVSFRIVLRGGTAFRDGRLDPSVAGDCATQLRASMQNITRNTVDSENWGNATIQAELLNANSLSYVEDKYGSLTLLDVTFLADSNYFTNRGENITFGSIPAVCIQSNEPISKTSTVPQLKITARIAVLSVVVASSPTSSDFGSLSAFPAPTLRVGGATIVITAEPNTDTFDVASVTAAKERIVNSFVCTSPQPFGFRATRDSIVNVTLISSLKIVVTFNALPQFAITAIENVALVIDASWTTSQQTPLINGNTTFVINPSPGSISLVDSLVQSAAYVTEDDIRAGNLWFQFSMIGDLWRQERDPYVAMFSGPTGESTGLLSLVDELVPSIEYFNFTSTNTSQYLTLQLQASDTYDISALETLRITFSAEAASSGLAPRFDQGDGSFTFQIRPSAGRFVVSGQTGLTEKIVREGGSILYLTLFGEKWTTTAAQCVRGGISITTSTTRNALLSSTIIPIYGNGMALLNRFTLSVTMFPARSGTNVYILGSTLSDTLRINISSQCVVSGITPLQGVTELHITSSQGELTLGTTTPSVITEDIVRTQSIQIQIVLDGSSWATGIDQQPLSISLLEGFSSTSSPLNEPSGFLVHRDALFSLRSLTVVPDILKTNKSITVRTVAQPTYDISEDEVITFTITDASFISNGVLPSPAQISFVVKALQQELVLMYQPPGGQFSSSLLEASVKNLLSISKLTSSTTSSSSSANATLYRPVATTLISQSGLLYVVSCAFNVTPTSDDPRTSVELLDALFALDSTYVYTQTGIKCSALSTATLCAAEAATPSPSSSSNSDDDAMTIAYWLIGAASVFALFAIVVAVAFLLHKRELGGGLRNGSTTHKMGRRTRVPHYLSGQGPTTSRQPVASRMLTPMSLRSYALSRNNNFATTAKTVEDPVFEETSPTTSSDPLHNTTNGGTMRLNASISGTNNRSSGQSQQQSRSPMMGEMPQLRDAAADERYRTYERLLKRNPSATRSVQQMMELDS
ncbi:membrane-associated protein, putative [Bodo saltans]|uniref:Membrane-associated protein, putative n=1 Tax=Bodo saltans TaxID=75058 RepID=A0A0S4JFC2_BODSA|nr:membrane-associated protein, putative [Bodo saltans]|eukprot:CUG88833.1 membrane-associated protein, putative [Bodo saltans]